jgi:hypothetical protein
MESLTTGPELENSQGRNVPITLQSYHNSRPNGLRNVQAQGALSGWTKSSLAAK